MYHWFRIVYKSYRCTGSVCTVLTSRSVPASVAPLRLQFFSLAFFSVATLRLIPVIWLPSMSTPLRLAPTTKTHSDEHDENFTCSLKAGGQIPHPPDWLWFQQDPQNYSPSVKLLQRWCTASSHPAGLPPVMDRPVIYMSLWSETC